MNYVPQIIHAIVWLALIGIHVWLIIFTRRKRRQAKRARELAQAPLKLEDKLAYLAECGISLNRPFTVNTLIAAWSREELEEPGWLPLLHALGGTEERQPWRRLCSMLYLFDFECIEAKGSYAAIITGLAAMTQGDLTLTDIDDQVEAGVGDTEISFTCNGRRVRSKVRRRDDWFDGRVIDCLAALLNRTRSPRVFFLIETGDQLALFGCLPRAQVEQLAQLGAKPVMLLDRLPSKHCTVA